MRRRSLWVFILSLWVLLFVFQIGFARAEPDAWLKTYGTASDNYARSIRQTADGGYIVSGWTNSPADAYDAWAAKLNGSGEIAWQKRYGSGQYTGLISMEQTSDLGFIGSGWCYPLAPATWNRYVWALKLYANGSVKWQKAYSTNSGEGRAIRPTPDGGFIVAGWCSGYGAGSDDLWVLKLDQNGNLQWQKTYGTSHWEEGRSVDATTDGGYIVAGFTNKNGNYDALVLKLDAAGGIQWQKTYGGDGDDLASHVRQTGDGGYIVAGGTGSFGFEKTKGWILKLDASGTIQWQRAYGDNGTHWLYAVAQTQDGGYVCAGESTSPVLGNQAMWVLKLDATGEIEWQRGLGGAKPGDCMAYSVVQAADGAYVAAGYTPDFGAGGIDVAVIKLDPDGNISGCLQDALAQGASYSTTAVAADGQNTVQDSSAAVASTGFPVNDPGFTATTVNYTSYSLCSLSSPPTLSWSPPEPVKSYEIEFSSQPDYASPVKIKTTSSHLTMTASNWKKVVNLPGAGGGWVYWRVTGVKQDKTRIAVLECSLLIEPPAGIEEASFSPTEKDLLPTLSWKNNCNVKFKVWFGADAAFSKKTTLSFKVKNPAENAGLFSIELTAKQWSSIRKLVGDATGAEIFWRVESWNALNQYFTTDVMSFTLAD